MIRMRFLWVACLVLAGCAAFTHPVARIETAPAGDGLPPYTGPRALVFVPEFDRKSAKVSSQAGQGLQETFINGLINSNRFRIASKETAGQAGQPKDPASADSGADLIVMVAVTEFEPQASGGAGGIGGGGGVGSGMLGGMLGATLNKAHMAMDIRIIDTVSSSVLAQTRVQGQASDMAGGYKGGVFGNWPLGPGLEAYADTPMEKAIRICLIEAVRYIWQTIPPAYFRY